MAEKRKNRPGVTSAVESKYSRKYTPETSTKTGSSSIKPSISANKSKERTKTLVSVSKDEENDVRKNLRNKVDNSNDLAKRSVKIKESKPHISTKPKNVMKTDVLKERPKSIMKTDVLKERPKSIVKTEVLKERPKSIVKTDVLKDRPKSNVRTDVLKDRPKSIVKADLLKERSKSVVKTDLPKERPKTVDNIGKVKAQVKNEIVDKHIEKGNSKVTGAIKNNVKSATFIKDDENSKVPVSSAQEEYVYEDDFEEYESDFEECTDEEDEVKSTDDDSTDSVEKTEDISSEEDSEKDIADEDTNYEESPKVEEMTTNDKNGKECDENASPLKVQKLNMIEELDSPENERVNAIESQNLLPLSTNKEHVWCSVYGSQRRRLNEKEAMRFAKRGEKLLKMIALDEISFMLFELPPVPYEVLMRTRNHGNMKQVSVQTNEDLLTEATQTDFIAKRDVWTQKPPILGSSGTDMEEDTMAKLGNISWSKLEKFIAIAGEMVIIMLEEQRSEYQPREQRGESTNILSDFSVLLGQEDTFANFWNTICSYRPINCAYFCKTLANLLICSHGTESYNMESWESSHRRDQVEDVDYFIESSILSVWNINEPSRPKCLLCCQGNVTKVCLGEYSQKNQQIAIAGTDEGTIYLWDFNDKGPNLRKKTLKTSFHEEALICPSFSTTGKQHLGRIVGLEIALHSVCEGEEFGLVNKITFPQVCSLDEWGNIFVWSVIKKIKNESETYELVPSIQLSLEEVCKERKKSSHGYRRKQHRYGPSNEFEEENGNWKSLAVGCNCMIAGSQSGCIVNVPLNCDVNYVQIYSACDDSFASAECIAVNPHGLPFYLVGNSFGKVELYDCITSQHLTSWNIRLESTPSRVTNIAWSPQRPLVFFVIEDDSRLSVWDLAVSDISPIGTLSTSKNKSNAFTVSHAKGSCPAYVAFGSESGQIILYQLREEFWRLDDEMRKTEISKFRKYTNHL